MKTNISPKVIFKQSENAVGVLTNTPSKKDYVLLGLTEKKGDHDDSSFKGKFDLLRLSSAKQVTEAIVFNQPKEFETSNNKNPNGDFRSASFLTGYSYPERMNYISNTSYEAKNSFLEFEAEITNEHKGRLNLGFYGTQNTSRAVEVLINGILVDEVDTTSQVPKTIFRSINVGSTVGKVKVKLKIKDDNNYIRGVHFLGYNAFDLNALTNKVETNGVLFNYGTNHYISRSTGANEYALRDAATGKWFGSYHGGEELLSRKMIADGQEINMSTSEVKLINTLTICQETMMVDSVKSTSVTDLSNDGTYSFEAFLKKIKPIELFDFYSCMTCSNNEFNKVLYPEIKTATMSNNTLLLENAGNLTQVNEATNQTIETQYIKQDDYFTTTPLRVMYFDGSYSKVYHGVTTGNKMKFESVIVGNSKIFN